MQAPALPRLRPFGDAALIVELGSTISPEVSARVLGFTQALLAGMARGEWPGVIECVPAYCSVTVHFDGRSDTVDPSQHAAGLLALAQAAEPLVRPGRQWRIPVCFDEDLAPDLHSLAQARGLSAQQVVDLMTSTPFRVYMLGFMPGFPYMGGLPATLEMPRRSSPRAAVPERSLAVAGRMCAVYPWRSPGGWHLLGRTPVRLFDASNSTEPALLRAGDEVRWLAIARHPFEEMQARGEAGLLGRNEWLAPTPS